LRLLRPEDVLYFLHIPRTGGTTLREAVARRFPAGTCLLAGSRRRFAEVMAALAPEDKRRLRFVSAHWDTSVGRLLGREPVLVTMLREPASRLKSHFDIVLRMPEHRLHAEIAAGMPFREWLEHPEGGVPERNRMTRLIAGTLDGAPGVPVAERVLLELAQERLADFAFFGIREAYEDSLSLLAATFDWSPFPPAPRLNPGGGKPLTAADREAALASSPLDSALYRFARSLFRERLAEIALAALPSGPPAPLARPRA
jgi:hypothetical protein